MDRPLTEDNKTRPGRKNGGYSYSPTMEHIRKHRALPIGMLLKWIEEADRLLCETMPEGSKKTTEASVRGRLRPLFTPAAPSRTSSCRP